MTAAIFRSKFCFSARCGVLHRWRRRSIAKPRKAGNCARRSQPNAKRCANSKLCRKAGLQSETAVTSYDSGVDRKTESGTPTTEGHCKTLRLNVADSRPGDNVAHRGIALEEQLPR